MNENANCSENPNISKETIGRSSGTSDLLGTCSTRTPAMDGAIAAGDSVLMNEQAALLRECRAALDELLSKKPTMAGMRCGTTTLGNLRAELYRYRPRAIFDGVAPNA